MSTAVFPTPTAAEIWHSRWCGRCHQPEPAAQRLWNKYPASRPAGAVAPPTCAIWRTAESGAVPEEWTRPGRNSRAAEDTRRCQAYLDKPPPARPAKAKPAPDQDVPLFATIEPQERRLVAVDGWPDYRHEGRRGGLPRRLPSR